MATQDEVRNPNNQRLWWMQYCDNVMIATVNTIAQNISLVVLYVYFYRYIHSNRNEIR